MGKVKPLTKEEFEKVRDEIPSCETEGMRLIATIDHLWDAAENERRAVVSWLRALSRRIDCPPDKRDMYWDIASDIANDCAGLRYERENKG